MQQADVRDFRRDLRKFERLVGSQQKGNTCCSGVTLAQCHTILEMEHLGKTTSGELAHSLGLDKSTLSRTVDGLVNIGLVSRVPHPADRRYTWLLLTDQGRSTCDEINRLNDLYYSQVFEAIPKGERPGVLLAFGLLVDAMIGAHLGEGEGAL
ncbi:MAG: hypothetical protein [Olavius algarvensis Delta 4 endosymbiont]|nr:MAG: hypothetical protein [Olavius algarvensis Delta 4 endosymbiont]